MKFLWKKKKITSHLQYVTNLQVSHRNLIYIIYSVTQSLPVWSTLLRGPIGPISNFQDHSMYCLLHFVQYLSTKMATVSDNMSLSVLGQLTGQSPISYGKPYSSVENSYCRSRVPVLGLGDLLPEAGSPGGRPNNPISQLLQPLDLQWKWSNKYFKTFRVAFF